MATKAVLLVITIIAALVIAQDSPNPSPELCKEICNNPREVKCPGPADASECRSDQVFKANGSLCGCCNACYTKRDLNMVCTSIPQNGEYYLCPEGAYCNYRQVCAKKS
ncbi:uncharacterized protein [Periplaneta americana]|uniref:uncharacterized protein n=1 Tax=Periplaneta americana TaxID=6978 RepID=UPI0037E7C7AA